MQAKLAENIWVRACESVSPRGCTAPDGRRPGVLASPRRAASPARTGASAPARRRSRRPGRPRSRRRRRWLCRTPQARPGRRRSRKLPIEPLRPWRRLPGCVRRRVRASRGRPRDGRRSPCARRLDGPFRGPVRRVRGPPPDARPSSAAPGGGPVEEPGRGPGRRCGRPRMRARGLLVTEARRGERRRWRIRFVGAATGDQRGAEPSGHCRVFPLSLSGSSGPFRSSPDVAPAAPDRGRREAPKGVPIEACTVQPPLPYGACSCMLPGTHAPWLAGSRTRELWAGEEWRRTLGGMGLGS